MQGILSASPVTLVILFLGLVCLIAAVTAAALLILSRAKGVRVHAGDVSVEVEQSEDTEATLVQHLEVRDYRHQLIQAFDLIQDDIRNRVRKNGWEKKANWQEYRTSAIESADTILTEELDMHYYYNAIVDRIALFEWNRHIAPEVRTLYAQMYDTMLAIVREGYAEIERKRTELNAILTNRECAPEAKRCPNAADIIQLTTEILIDQHMTIRERCMVEAERVLAEIVRRYYSHYLTLYKVELEKIKK